MDPACFPRSRCAGHCGPAAVQRPSVNEQLSYCVITLSPNNEQSEDSGIGKLCRKTGTDPGGGGTGEHSEH